MVVVPLSKATNESQVELAPRPAESNEWVKFAAGGSLLAGGLLLLSGNKRAGLVAAVSGATMVLIDQKETLRVWWDAVPGLLDEAGGLLNEVERVLAEIDLQRQKLRLLVGK